MYTPIQLQKTDFLLQLFPSIIITPEVEERIKKIHFCAKEFSKGFVVGTGSILKKFKENNIVVYEKTLLKKQVVLTDQEATAVGLEG